jgi:hypothetical protein
MEKIQPKKIVKDGLIKLAIRIGMVTEKEVAERKKQGLPWNFKPKK